MVAAFSIEHHPPVSTCCLSDGSLTTEGELQFWGTLSGQPSKSWRATHTHEDHVIYLSATVIMMQLFLCIVKFNYTDAS